MQIIFQCPACLKRVASAPEGKAAVACDACDWNRDEGATDFDGEYCRSCRVCGCKDLWRQKDFPPGLGLLMVGIAATASTIAWAWYEPLWAIAALLAAALVDMVLFASMNDMLVCYRCRARHRKTALDEEHSSFDLEVSERYVQMEKRLRE